ncbi:MAG: bifunctional 3-demethylubiquinone 3-O-methyltransferase/2-octaprenyl-6-hydroxy phenol methylase [Gammaproteobacteria bacterium]|nr:MAG: bifunctional 3-demethylubiquinone 3-O-methyltransferase/2-octaprenyl-6-hydroxy phenol methylase [Gammaproteobacteria bacterium]
MTTPDTNTDPAEVAKFEALASRWWDPQGAFKPLHDINPLRLAFVEASAGLAGKTVIDVGCGGGILAESMAARGAVVTGIDAGEAVLASARLHLEESSLEVDYVCATAEQMAKQRAGAFDLVTCMELLEHVPDPASVVAACARLARPGGEVIFSTINRNPKAYALAVIGAEYLLRLLPRGTHDYAKFIRPSELDGWSRSAGLTLEELQGLTYNPVTRRYRLTGDVDVNYLARLRRVVAAGD